MSRLSLCVPLLLLAATGLRAQEGKGKDAAEKVVKTRHVVTIGGHKIDYEAAAGTLTLKTEEGKPTARLFYVAYRKLNAQAASRPITFCFNGGPGSSAVWLHLGAFGPKRVQLDPKGEMPRPPVRLIDNEFSLLDVTDLVFIDPVSTGYSRAAEEKDAKKFHGVQGDIESVGEFIRAYLTRNGRWRSPRFLAGESYGTTRAAALANHLQNRHGLNLNGVILVSAVLNFQTIAMAEGNELPYALFLPAYAATAWYHKKLDKELQADLRRTLAAAETFAQGEYTLALMKGNRLGDAERQAVTRKLALLTGLSEEFVRRNDLRIEPSRFRAELLRDRGLVFGRFDSTITAPATDAAANRPDFDPSYASVQGPFTAALQQYVRGELGYESDLNYEILTGRVQPWNYGQAATNRYLNVAPQLRDALVRNRYLRVFVASGYYDLATPFSATEYTLAHLGDQATARRVTHAYYEGGHMMYTRREQLRRLKEDLGRFYDAAPRAGAGAP